MITDRTVENTIGKLVGANAISKADLFRGIANALEHRKWQGSTFVSSSWSHIHRDIQGYIWRTVNFPVMVGISRGITDPKGYGF